MIQGYPQRSSLRPGEVLTLHVATDAPQLRIEFFRQGETLESVPGADSPTLAGHNAPLHPSDADWGVEGQDVNGQPLAAWAGYDVPIPADWRTGVYIAMFTELDESGQPTRQPDRTTADARDAKALFVVKSASPGSTATIIYKLALLTFQAYNMTGEPQLSFYNGGTNMSLRRPGGGTGGTPNDIVNYPDVYDLSSPRETYAHWDSYFISWLERSGYQVEYCTDLDVHEDSTLLGHYKLMLSVGHDEYWSTEMRANVSAFVAGAGNVAFFSANTCWWQALFSDASNSVFERTDFWYNLGSPENTITGVSYRNAGGQWDGPRPKVLGFTVQHADHWVFDGTGLREGQVFGDYYHGNQNDPAALVGYECDGALFDRATWTAGQIVTPSRSDGTPDSFEILGIADVTGWIDYDGGNHAATMGLYTESGTVFTAATSDWPRVLASGKEPSVERITRNVLDRLSG